MRYLPILLFAFLLSCVNTDKKQNDKPIPSHPDTTASIQVIPDPISDPVMPLPPAHQNQPPVHRAVDLPIKVTSSMVKALSGDNTAFNLFDTDGSGNAVLSTYWHPGWNSAAYPATALVDFGQAVNVKTIRYYDGTGIPLITMSSQLGMESPEVFYSEKMDKYLAWRTVTVNKKMRYLYVTLSDAQGHQMISAVEIFSSDEIITPGDSTIVITPPPPPPPPPGDSLPPIITKFTGAALSIGACTFQWVDPVKMSRIPRWRPYTPRHWFDKITGLWWQPQWQAQKPPIYLGLDDYLALGRKYGTIIMPCFSKTPTWTITGTDSDYDEGQESPLPPGKDRSNPASYVKAAEFFKQAAIRYGNKKFAPGVAKVATGDRYGSTNTPKTGLGLLDEMEPGNEEEPWWFMPGNGWTSLLRTPAEHAAAIAQNPDQAAYMLPEEFAAYLICVSDSVRKYSDMKIVMPGLTGADMRYLRRMDAAFIARGRTFASVVDVINIHRYSNVGNKPGDWPPTWYNGGAVCPEEDKSFVDVAEVVAFAKKRGLPVYCTEFGYDDKPNPNSSAARAFADPFAGLKKSITDSRVTRANTRSTNLNSWQYITPFGGLTTDEIKAQWMVRSYLEYIRYGVAAAFMFNMSDEEGADNGGLYQSSGLLRSEGKGFTEKPAYTAVVNLVSELNGFEYVADLSTANARVMLFKGATGQKIIAWSPTATNRKTTVNLLGCDIAISETPVYRLIKD